jgi:hypothetical protein
MDKNSNSLFNFHKEGILIGLRFVVRHQILAGNLSRIDGKVVQVTSGGQRNWMIYLAL